VPKVWKLAQNLATKGTQEVAIKTRQGYDAQAYLNERATSRSGCILL